MSWGEKKWKEKTKHNCLPRHLIQRQNKSLFSITVDAVCCLSQSFFMSAIYTTDSKRTNWIIVKMSTLPLFLSIYFRKSRNPQRHEWQCHQSYAAPNIQSDSSLVCDRDNRIQLLFLFPSMSQFDWGQKKELTGPIWQVTAAIVWWIFADHNVTGVQLLITFQMATQPWEKTHYHEKKGGKYKRNLWLIIEEFGFPKKCSIVLHYIYI